MEPPRRVARARARARPAAVKASPSVTSAASAGSVGSGARASPAKMPRRSGRRASARRRKPPTPPPEPEPQVTLEDEVMTWWLEVRRTYHPHWQRPDVWKCPEARSGGAKGALGAVAGAGSRKSGTRTTTSTATTTPTRRFGQAQSPGAKGAGAGAGAGGAARTKSAPALVAPAVARPCGPFACYGLHNCYLLDTDDAAARHSSSAARLAALRKKTTGPKPFIAGGALATGAATGLGAGGRRRPSQHLLTPRGRGDAAASFVFDLDAEEGGVRAAYRARLHAAPRAAAQLNRRLRAQLVARAVPLGGSWSASSALRVGELCRLRKVGVGEGVGVGDDTSGYVAVPVLKAPSLSSSTSPSPSPSPKPTFNAEESSLLKEAKASLGKKAAHAAAFRNPKSRSVSPHSPKSRSSSPPAKSSAHRAAPTPRASPHKSTKATPLKLFKSPQAKIVSPKSPPSRVSPALTSTSRTSLSRASPSKSPPPRSLSPATSTTSTVATKKNPARDTPPSKKRFALAKRLGSPMHSSTPRKRVSPKKMALVSSGHSAGSAAKKSASAKSNALKTSSCSLLKQRAGRKSPSPSPSPSSPASSPSPSAVSADGSPRRVRVKSCVANHASAAVKEDSACLLGRLSKNRSTTTLLVKVTPAEAEAKGEEAVKAEKVSGRRSGARSVHVHVARRRSESHLVHAARSEADKWLASRAGVRRQTADVKMVDLLLGGAVPLPPPLPSHSQPKATRSATRLGAGTAWGAGGATALSSGLLRPKGADALPLPSPLPTFLQGERPRRRQGNRPSRLASTRGAATEAPLSLDEPAARPRRPSTPPPARSFSLSWAPPPTPGTCDAQVGGDSDAPPLSPPLSPLPSRTPSTYAPRANAANPDFFAGSQRMMAAILRRKSKDQHMRNFKMFEEFSKMLQDDESLGCPKAESVGCQTQGTQMTPPTQGEAAPAGAMDVQTSPRSPYGRPPILSFEDMSFCDAALQTPKSGEACKSADEACDADEATVEKQTLAFDTILDMVMKGVEEGAPARKARAGARERKQSRTQLPAGPRWMRLLEASRREAIAATAATATAPAPTESPRKAAWLPARRSPPSVEATTAAEAAQSPETGIGTGTGTGTGTEAGSEAGTGTADALALALAPSLVPQQPIRVDGVSLRRMETSLSPPPAATAAAAGAAAGLALGAAVGAAALLPLRTAASGPHMMALSRPKAAAVVEERLAAHRSGVEVGAELVRGGGTQRPNAAPASDARCRLRRPQLTPQQIPRVPTKLAAAGRRARHSGAALGASEEEEMQRLLAPVIPRARSITSSSLGHLMSSLRRAERLL